MLGVVATLLRVCLCLVLLFCLAVCFYWLFACLVCVAVLFCNLVFALVVGVGGLGLISCYCGMGVILLCLSV